MVNVDKIKSLAKSKGIKYSYICEQLGLQKGYLNDVASGKTTMSDERIRKIAEILDTTYDYLTDQTKYYPELESDREKLRHNMAHPNESHETFMQRIRAIEEANKKEKFNDLYQQIAKKETAEADLAELERFMEYLAKRGG